MILVVGLGNPGQKFQKTRHNIGRLVISSWRKLARFSDFQFQKKFNALISKGIFDKKNIVLALPETFMNLSGKPVQKIINNYQLTINNLFVIHDDIDLPLGKIRISKGRGAGGHKGVQSIIDELKTKSFGRFRIGINHETCHIKHETAEKFVLGKFTKEEEKIVKEVIKKTVEAVEFSLKNGLEKAMSRFNI